MNCRIIHSAAYSEWGGSLRCLRGAARGGGIDFLFVDLLNNTVADIDRLVYILLADSQRVGCANDGYQ